MSFLSGVIDGIRRARAVADSILASQRLARWLKPRPGFNPARRLKRAAMRDQGLSPRQFRKQYKRDVRNAKRRQNP